MEFRYKKAIVGGTFDHLHKGHHKLLNRAFENSDQVTIGLAKPALYQHKLLSFAIETYETREEALKNYLQEQNLFDRATIIPIEDIYGNTLSEKDIDAIFATKENEANCHQINTKRKEIGFPELTITIVDYLMDENGEKISSDRIRKGEIDRQGFVYQNLFKQDLIMPEKLREQLQKPLGEVWKNTGEVLHMLTKKTIVISVGDIVTQSLIDSKAFPAIGIIDFKTRRQELPIMEPKGSLKTTNQQGTINTEAVNTYQTALNKYLETTQPQSLIVDGEEDLLALPAILLAPLDSVVLYGQFDQGVVVNKVTEEKKKAIKDIIYMFV